MTRTDTPTPVARGNTYGEWQDISSAPKDGTWIIGRDADGVEAHIQSRRIHPKVDTRHWAVGDLTKEGSWLVSKCFYPVEWRADDACSACKAPIHTCDCPDIIAQGVVPAEGV